MNPTQGLSASAPAVALETKYNSALGYLRAFVVALVVAHHAVLGYCTFAPPAPASLLAAPRWWQAFPVVDNARWIGFDVLAGFNDTFFMSMMFLVSGLFVWSSVRRKGTRRFLQDRLLRLGVPFVVLAGIIAPLAYYPAYLRTPGHAGVGEFVQQWMSLGDWPAGPGWFLWVLLVFDCIAALVFASTEGAGRTITSCFTEFSRRPLAFFGLLTCLSATVYVPLALKFNPLAWSSFGPFFFQTSRILHYLLYFLVGVALGAGGLERGLLARDGKLQRRWPLWSLRALLLFSVSAALGFLAATAHPLSIAWAVAADIGFVLSCAASCFALAAVFLRFVRTRSGWGDSIAANSYGIYVIHYAVVSWLAYALLPASWPAIGKGSVVTFGAFLLSWAISAGVRRVPGVARIL